MRLIFRVFVILVSIAITHKIIMSEIEPPLKSKPAPEYKTIDPLLAPIVNEYKSLADKKGIKFTNQVTIGFTDIKHKDIVGLCHYGSNFREIDIDRKYWGEITENEQKELVFHELTHCYCLRKHDYDEGKPYPEAKQSKYVRGHQPVPRMPPYKDAFFISPGFLIDGCPASIMYPYVLNDACYEKNKEYYDSEMFNRCQPY
jgi:Putative phage metallopeptidase